MRLKDVEVAAIKDTVYEYDPEAKIYLFGSRADDAKRGGDIGIKEKWKIRNTEHGHGTRIYF